MVMLVTAQQAKDRCKLDSYLADADLIGMIEQASAVVLNYLKVGFETYADSSGTVQQDSSAQPVGVPHEVQLAVLCMVGILARDPDLADMKNWERGYPPDAVVSILTPLRDPALG